MLEVTALGNRVAETDEAVDDGPRNDDTLSSVLAFGWRTKGMALGGLHDLTRSSEVHIVFRSMYIDEKRPCAQESPVMGMTVTAS